MVTVHHCAGRSGFDPERLTTLLPSAHKSTSATAVPAPPAVVRGTSVGEAHAAALPRHCLAACRSGAHSGKPITGTSRSTALSVASTPSIISMAALGTDRHPHLRANTQIFQIACQGDWTARSVPVVQEFPFMHHRDRIWCLTRLLLK